MTAPLHPGPDTRYGTQSQARLALASDDLRRLFVEVDPRFPHSVLEVARTAEQQAQNVATGVSQTLDSRHLDGPPANAVDAAPDPLRWPKLPQQLEALLMSVGVQDRPGFRTLLAGYVKQVARWYYFGGYVLGTADQMRRHGELTRPVRWGGDWNGDRQVDDQRFDDLPHFEHPKGT